MQYVELNSETEGFSGGLEDLADSGNVTKTAKKTRKISKNHQKYASFIRATKAAGVDVDRTMNDLREKKRILIEVMGYKNLMGRGGRVNILEAKGSRIGEAYRACYDQARQNHPDL